MTRFRILGPIEARVGDHRLPVGGRTQVKVLAFLLLHANRAVSSDALNDAVWGEARSGGGNRLQMAIARLRKALAPLDDGAGPVLRTVGGGYLLSVAPGESDVDVFVEEVQDARRALEAGEPARAAESLVSALALWRGAPLAEVCFEDFAQSEVRRLEELHVEALEARIDADLQLGRHARLISELEGLLAEHPSREHLAAQLMLALYRSGRQADALDVYQRTRTHLMEELGLEPGPALRELQAQILEQSQALGGVRHERLAVPANSVVGGLGISSSALVGRSVELAELEAAFADAAVANPRFVFVAGGSGVGKTRLVCELAERASASGARVLGGECIELGEAELPYAPLVAAMRPLARARDPILDELPGSVRAELATLLPELGDSTVDLGHTRGESDQRHLFEALLWLLNRLGREAPVLLAIEDLHWADRATRGFIVFLSRSLRRERVLVVATYRTDELNRRHPLRPLLAELERNTGSRRIELPPLTRDELYQQLRNLLGAPPDEGLVERVFERSEGYPLFVEEMIASSLDGRGPLPSTLRDALMVRIERLPASAQDALRVIAVGQVLDDELLAEGTGLDQPALQEALREAVANHILILATEGGFRFRHALLREVVVADLLPGERKLIDLQLARSLEARLARGGPSLDLPAAIAHHYTSAHEWPAALRASVRAAEAAEHVHAHAEAAALLERADDLFDRVPDPASLAGGDRATILDRAAENHYLELNTGREEALLRRALSLVDERTGPRRAARLLGHLHEAQWQLGLADESLATIKHALSLLPPGETSHERGTLLGAQARTSMLRGKYVEAVALVREALNIADALGDTRLRANGLNTLGTSLISLGEVDRGMAALRKALVLAQEQADVRGQMAATVNLADSLQLVGRLGEARGVIDDCLAWDLPPRRDWLMILRGELAFEAGEWDEAEAIFASVRGHQVGNTLVNFDLRRAELALGRGDHALARRYLDEAAGASAAMQEPQFTAVLGALRAELERRENDITAARDAINDAVCRVEARTDDSARLARVSAVGVTVEAYAAQRARDLRDSDDERLALAQAHKHVARGRSAARHGGPLEGAWLLRARADQTRARGASDPRAYAVAAEAWGALERPYPAALMRFGEAEAFARAGNREGAIAAALNAHKTAAQLGAGCLLREIEGLAARTRLPLVPNEASNLR
ncbi:MAG: BTAD domain-containing putative transcriptional regulator [Solirubrobacteraceae bacterium]